jgi:hypothetical protein
VDDEKRFDEISKKINWMKDFATGLGRDNASNLLEIFARYRLVSKLHKVDEWQKEVVEFESFSTKAWSKALELFDEIKAIDARLDDCRESVDRAFPDATKAFKNFEKTLGNIQENSIANVDMCKEVRTVDASRCIYFSLNQFIKE